MDRFTIVRESELHPGDDNAGAGDDDNAGARAWDVRPGSVEVVLPACNLGCGGGGALPAAATPAAGSEHPGAPGSRRSGPAHVALSWCQPPVRQAMAERKTVVIVGPTASGKSTLLSNLRGQAARDLAGHAARPWDSKRAIVSQFATGTDGAKRWLSCCGLNSIPSWVRARPCVAWLASRTRTRTCWHA